MNESGATFVMILLFALRCIVPLALTVLIGWLMNRLVEKWEAEETAVTKPSQPQNPKPTPEKIPRRPIPALIDCWVFNHCEESDCEAFGNTAVKCWQTKKTASGKLLPKCETCPVYTQTIPAV